MATMSYAQGETWPPLIESTIGDRLDATAAAFGDRDAMVEVATGRRWSYAQFADEVNRLARALVASGIEVGDRVGIWAPNCAEWTITQFATARIGAILVTINPSYRSHELEYVLRQSGAAMLVAVEAFKTSDYRGMVEQVRGSLTTLREVIYIGTSSWADLIDLGATVDEARVTQIRRSLSNTDPINIQYTSGTTGFPKGATLSHRNILNNGFFVGQLCGYTEVDRVCIPVPFYHCFGMVMGNLACVAHGAAMIIPAAGFDPAATLAAVQSEKCTSLYGVPTMFIAEWALPNFADHDLSSVRTGIMAGSPCPAELMKKLIAAGIEEVTICYGMTETSPVSTQNRTDDTFEQKVGTVGRVGPHLEIKIVDDAGQTTPRGVAGEFWTRGYSVMLGYWEQPDKTAEAIEGGWMRSGDIGVMDQDGYVQITGRIKDLVIRGGENVYPREIEEFLYTHPDIHDAQVIGVPDPRYGEELCAWIQMKPGATPLDAQSLREFCAGRLAHYKIPRYVEIVDGFPMTVTGKVRKVEMREISTKRLGLEVPVGSVDPVEQVEQVESGVGGVQRPDEGELASVLGGADYFGRHQPPVGHIEPEPGLEPDPEPFADAPPPRRVSFFEEVRDGGYGVGSAAPIYDGAIPLGHEIRGHRSTMTYRAGEFTPDEAEPDVWFYDEDAARRNGFTLE